MILLRPTYLPTFFTRPQIFENFHASCSVPRPAHYICSYKKYIIYLTRYVTQQNAQIALTVDLRKRRNTNTTHTKLHHDESECLLGRPPGHNHGRNLRPISSSYTPTQPSTQRTTKRRIYCTSGGTKPWFTTVEILGGTVRLSPLNFPRKTSDPSQINPRAFVIVH